AAFWWLAVARDSPRRWVRVGVPTVVVLLAVFTIFVGVSLGFTGHMNNFNDENHRLYLRLVKRLSLCRRH
ncbi:MAG: hypothetical protein ABW321_34570, partial [Polyangiales bacterium]